MQDLRKIIAYGNILGGIIAYFYPQRIGIPDNYYAVHTAKFMVINGCGMLCASE